MITLEEIQGIREAIELLRRPGSIRKCIAMPIDELEELCDLAASHTAQESRGEVVWEGEVEVIPGCAYSRHKLFFSMEEAPDVSLDKLRDFEHHVTIMRITLPSTDPPVPQTVNVEEEKSNV